MKPDAVNLSALGVGWAFPPQFEITGKVIVVADEVDIHESLLILLSTVPGERIMHPTFGCGLKALIFEQINESLLTKIRDVVTRSILLFEPRITLERLSFNQDEIADGLLKIEIFYFIRATQTPYNLVYPFYLDSGATYHG